MNTILVLSIMAELTQHPVTSVWVRAEYRGPATTWTARLLPQGGPGQPYWFGGGDTVTVSGRRDHWWLVSSTDPAAIFTAELLEEGE